MHIHHACPTPLHGPQTLLGAENVTDVAFDTPGLPHPWCAEGTRTSRKKAALYAALPPPPPEEEDGPAIGARRLRFSLNGRHHDAPTVARHGVEARLHLLHSLTHVLHCSPTALLTHLLHSLTTLSLQNVPHCPYSTCSTCM